MNVIENLKDYDQKSDSGVEKIMNELNGDPERYTEFVSANYKALGHKLCVRIVQESMCWPSNAKFRFKYSCAVFNHFSFQLQIGRNWLDNLGEDIALQWLWKNKGYFAKAINYSVDTFAARMFVQLRDSFSGDQSWDKPLGLIADLLDDDVDI
jgi:hypothetical protein